MIKRTSDGAPLRTASMRSIVTLSNVIFIVSCLQYNAGAGITFALAVRSTTTSHRPVRW